MRKLLPLHLLTTLLFLFVAYIGTAFAAGHIGFRNVVSYMRTKEITFHLNPTHATNDVTAGTDGVLAVTTANAVTSYTLTAFSPPVSPCKVNLLFIDDATTPNTLGACAFTIVGYDQYGNAVSETTASVGESNVESARVYEKLTRVTATGCTAGGDATDYFRIACSDEYGVGMPISDPDQVVACVYDGTNTICRESGDTGFDAAVDTDDDSIDIESINGITITDGDAVMIRVRSPAN